MHDEMGDEEGAGGRLQAQSDAPVGRRSIDFERSGSWNAAVERSPVVILRVDREGLILAATCSPANPVVDAAVGGRLYSRLLDEDRRRVEKALAHVFESGAVERSVFAAGHGDGQVHWYDCVMLMAPGEANADAALVIATDMTERVVLRQELVERAGRYRALIENQNTLVVTLAPDLCLTYANPAYCETFGLREDEILGKPFWPLIHEEDRARIKHSIMSAFQEPYTCRHEERALTVDGWRWLAWSNRAILGESGKVEEVIAVGRDVTARKEAETALRESEARYRDLVEMARIGVLVDDVDGNVVFANERAAHMFGYSVEEMRSMRIDSLFHQDDIETVLSYHQARLHGEGAPARFACRGRRSDGSELHLELDVVMVVEDGRPAGTRAYLWDVTERKKLEQELVKLDKLQSVGTLAGGIAHDFNNLLTGILGNISLAKLYAAQDDMVMELLREAEAASLQAKNLTQRLLIFARGGSPIMKTMWIDRLVEDSTRFALQGANSLAQFSIETDLWPTRVDEGQIGQVIRNIVLNADEAMPNGGIVRVAARNVMVNVGDALPLSAGPYVMVSISDAGIGIAAEYLPRLFDPYFTTKQQGSGLGLAVAHSVIAAHGGHIAVESALGHGSSFHLYLPAAPSAADVAPAPPAASMSGTRVLIMDDEKIVRDVAAAILNHLRCRVAHAENGEGAIAQYRAAAEAGDPFDLVIMDLTIPGAMGGELAVQELLKYDSAARVIVSSGYSNDPIMIEYEKYGFRGVMTKPYSLQEMESVLHRVLSG
jgi:PAS domain S-box-containing protein